jgi:hypothetical protein
MVNDDERDSTIFLRLFKASRGRWKPGKVGKLENHPRVPQSNLFLQG